MHIWIFLILSLIFIKAIMRDLSSKRKQKIFLLISGIITILIIGLRYPAYDVVYDLRVYYEYYQQMIHTSWNEVFILTPFEPGYAVLNKILSTLIPWPQFILIFTAIFTVFSVCKFIYRNTEYPFQAYLFYVTLGTMSFQLTAFRQAYAISICLLSVELIKEKKMFKFLISILLAMSFHKSAIVFLPFYFIANRKVNLINNLLSIFAILISVQMAGYLTRFGNNFLDTNYGEYVGSKFGGIVPITIYIISIIISLIYTKKRNDKVIFNMSLLGLAIYLMRYTTLALERISFFFSPSLIVQIPNAINMERNKKTRLLLNVLFVVFAILLFMYRLSNAEYANYRFFWE